MNTDQRIKWLQNLLYLNKVDMAVDDVISNEITGQLTVVVTLDLPTVNKEIKGMTDEQFRQLNRGDIVRNVGDDRAYVVTANYGNRITAVHTADLTNPDEWELVSEKETGKVLNEIEVALISIADGVQPSVAVQRAFDIINCRRESRQ